MIDPKKKALSLVDEFKNFALKGNVIDLAVGVIIGAAFGKIVSSLVENIIMPVIGLVLPDPGGYKVYGIDLGEGRFIPTGLFFADVINFIIVAIALFFFTVKFLGFIMRHKKEEAAAPPPPTREEELLMEIRDLLKQGRS